MTVTPEPVTRTRAPNGWLALGGVLTVLVVVVGALSVAGWLGYRTETQRQVYRQVATSISIEIDTGDVMLLPGEPGIVDIERRLFWSYLKPTIDEEWDDQTLRVSSDCRWSGLGPGCGVNYTLRVPEGISVQAQTSTGDVSVSNIRGELRLTTSTGDVRVTACAGALYLRSATGDVTASDVTSDAVDASTSTGDVTLDLTAVPQTVSARSSTGNVRVAVPNGGEAYQVRTDTDTGNARVSVRQDEGAGRSIVARTSTGDIEISYG